MKLNKVNYAKHPKEYPDTDNGNYRLFFELELLRSEYETCKCPTKLQRYTQIIDTLGDRGQFVEFNSDLAIDKDLRKYDWYSMVSKPIPTPGEGESQDAFIGRCMHAIGDEYDDKKQAVAICYSTWRKHKNKK